MKKLLAAIGGFVRRHPLGSGGVALGIIAVAALVFTHPWSVTTYSLQGGSAWITRSNQSQIRRIATPVHAEDAYLAVSTGATQVLQDGENSLVSQQGSLTAINPSTVVKGGSVPLPKDATPNDVRLSDHVLAVESVEKRSTGKEFTRVYVGSFLGGPPSIDTTTPAFGFPGGGPFAVGQDGTVVAFSPANSLLYVLPRGATQPTTSRMPASIGGVTEVTTLNGQGVLLSEQRDEVVFQDGSISDLSAFGSGAQLQASSDTAGETVVATTEGLVRVGEASTPSWLFRSSGLGVPIPPVVDVHGCVYGAWQGAGAEMAVVCPGQEPVAHRLATADGWQGSPVPALSSLTFRFGALEPVLNDTDSGSAFVDTDGVIYAIPWTVQSQSPSLVIQKNIINRNPNANGPIQLNPEYFDAIDGTLAQLPVLVGDYDLAGDQLYITGVTGPPGVPTKLLYRSADETTVALDLRTANDQNIIARAIVGSKLVFSYVVSNGRGVTSGPGKVIVTLLAAKHTGLAPLLKNPQQAPVLYVPEGGSVSYDVLKDWFSPEGTPLFIVGAVVTGGAGPVTWTPSGWLNFGPYAPVPNASVLVTVGQADGLTATYDIALKLPTNAPPVVVDDVVVGAAGQPVTAWPLHNDIDPTAGGLKLGNAGNAVIKLSANDPIPVVLDNSIKIDAQLLGSYSYQYTATDSAGSTTGYVRFQILNAPIPVVNPVSVLLPAGGSVTADLLADDSDAGGGVLAVTSVAAPPVGSGIATLLDRNQQLRVQDVGGGAPGLAAELDYTVSDGSAATSVTSQVLIYRQPTNPQLPAVVAPDIIAAVQAGNVITVPVLRSAQSTLGRSLTLDTKLTLVSSPATATGIAWTDGSDIRFRAGTVPGDVQVRYELSDVPPPGGLSNTAAGTVTLTIVHSERAGLATPPTLNARVAENGTVTIPVPLDANSDPVSLVGASSSPINGGKVLTGSGGSSFVYMAPPDPVQDSFGYEVRDAFGQIGRGTVNVVVFGRDPADPPPSAIPAQYLLRLHSVATLPVLDNASDPEDRPLAIADLTAPPDFGVSINQDQQLVVDVPSSCSAAVAGECKWILSYRATDGYESSSPVTVTILANQATAGLPPTAQDIYPPYPPVGQAGIFVAVLQYVTDPNGAVANLSVTLPGQPANAKVVNHVVDAELGSTPYSLVYEVTDTTTNLSAEAVIWIPGRSAVLPTLAPNLSPIQVTAAGAHVSTLLSHYVSVPSGYTAAVEGVAPNQPVAVWVAPDGPSMIQVWALPPASGLYRVYVVVSAIPAGQSSGPEVTLGIPVKVTGYVPPVKAIQPTVDVDVYQGLSTSVNLLQDVDDPAGNPSALSFQVDQGSNGVSCTQSGSGGSSVTVSAAAQQSGQTVPIRVTVDEQGSDQPATFDLEVHVQAIQLVVSTVPISATIDTGESEPISIGPSVITSSRVSGAAPTLTVRDAAVEGMIPGWTAIVSGTTVTVTAGGNYLANNVTIGYTVVATLGGSSMSATGVITLTTKGAPGAPNNVVAQANPIGGGTQALLTWSSPPQNGAPITTYKVLSNVGDLTCSPNVALDDCTVTGLAKGQAYTFSVSAKNSVGYGPSGVSNEITAANVPGPPTGVTATPENSSAVVTFTPPLQTGGDGVGISSYTVTASPGNESQSGTTRTITVSGLTNGTTYRFYVTANNEIGPGTPSSMSNPVTPYTVPGAPTMVTAHDPKPGANGLGNLDISWTPPSVNGGSPITKYVVVDPSNPSLTCTATEPAGGDSCTVTGLVLGTDYAFRVTAFNIPPSGGSPEPGETSAASTPLAPTGAPEAPVIIQVTPEVNSFALITISYSNLNSGGEPITAYNVKATDLTSAATGPTCSSPTPSCNLHPLVTGDRYTFTATVINQLNLPSPNSSPYPSVGAMAFDTPPFPPTSVSATPGQVEATVSWMAPGSNGSTPIVSYTVTAASQNGQGSTGEPCMVTPPWPPILQCTVHGLTAHDSYLFTVTASNQIPGVSGSGSSAATSAPVVVWNIPPGVPPMPTATPGPDGATVNWSAPAPNGGTPIVSYNVTPANLSEKGSNGEPCSVVMPAPLQCPFKDLTANDKYDFTVTASNTIANDPYSGTSGSSAASTPIVVLSSGASGPIESPRLIATRSVRRLGATIMTSVLAAMNSQDTNSRGPSPLSSDKLTSTERIGDRVATVKNQTEGTGAQASHQNLSTSKSRILVPLVRLDAERQLVGGT